MEYDADRPPFRPELPLRHQFERPPDGHRDDGRPPRDRQEEPAPAEPLELPVEAPCPLREYQEGIPFLPYGPRGLLDALDSPAPGPSVHRHAPHMEHRPAEDGDAKDILLHDHPDGLRDDHDHHRPVEEAQVVGHEDIRGLVVESLEAANLDVDAENAPSDAHGPPADSHERLPYPQDPADEEDGPDEDDDEGVNEEQERRAHVISKL